MLARRYQKYTTLSLTGAALRIFVVFKRMGWGERCLRPLKNQWPKKKQARYIRRVSTFGRFMPIATVRFGSSAPSTRLAQYTPKTRPVVRRFQMHVLGKVTRQGEQARSIPELKHPIEMKLLLSFLGEHQLVVTD